MPGSFPRAPNYRWKRCRACSVLADTGSQAVKDPAGNQIIHHNMGEPLLVVLDIGCVHIPDPHQVVLIQMVADLNEAALLSHRHQLFVDVRQSNIFIDHLRDIVRIQVIHHLWHPPIELLVLELHKDWAFKDKGHGQVLLKVNL